MEAASVIKKLPRYGKVMRNFRWCFCDQGVRFLNQKKTKLEHAVPRPCVLNTVRNQWQRFFCLTDCLFKTESLIIVILDYC